MSEIKVNKLSPRSGTAVTLGDSGDTFTIPSGATLAIAGSVTGFTSAGIDDNATSVAITINSSEQVGIGTTSPASLLDVQGTGVVATFKSTNNNTVLRLKGNNATNGGALGSTSSDSLTFLSGLSEKARIDASGNFFVAKTSSNIGTDGIELRAGGDVLITNSGAQCMYLNRKSSDGTILELRKDGTAVGVIGSQKWGIGTASPDSILNIVTNSASNGDRIRIQDGTYKLDLGVGATSFIQTVGASALKINTNATERIRIDASGNTMFGKSTQGDVNLVGAEIRSNGVGTFTRDGDTVLIANRKSSNGTILEFRKDNTSVGSIGIQTGGLTVDGEANHSGIRFSASSFLPRKNNADVNGTVDLGTTDGRWKDLYLGNSIDLSKSANQTQVNIRSTTTPNGSKVGGEINLSLGSGSNSGSGNTSTQIGDILGNINFNGQGTDFSFQGGGIEVKQTTPIGQTNRTDAGCDMIFKVISAGGTGYTEKLRIKSSGGITFNGDTSVNNALDDYEQGTFTPSLSIASSAAAGFYTKIGNIVHAYFKITTGATGSNITINGLPFATKSSNPDVIGGARETQTSGRFYQIAASQSNTSAFIFRYDNSNSISSGMVFQGSLIYQTN